jgi:hypothetical protein
MKKLLLFLLASSLANIAVAAAPAAARLRAGAATSNITPPIGALRVGGFVPAPSTHVHDELHARCLVLDDGKTKVALVVCDLLGFHRSVSLEARRLIQEAIGIPPENVMISATHTHSAGSALGTSRYVNEQELDDYQRFVARRIADGVQRAHNNLRPAEIAFRSVDLPEPLLNRRWVLKEGKTVTNPFGKIEKVHKTGAPGPEFSEPAGPTDTALSIVALREPAGRLIAAYCAYSMHYAGMTMAGAISADYFVAMMANATSGDVGPNQKRYNHLDKTHGPYGRSRAAGNEVAQAADKALKSIDDWKDHAELSARFRELDIKWRTIEPELLAWAKEIEAKAPRLASGPMPIAAKWATTPDWATRLSYAGRVQALAAKTDHVKFPVQVLRLGEICIGTSPCETYAEIGLDFKKRSPFTKSFMVSLNHAMIGYLPPPYQLERGEYSTWPGTNIVERETSVKMLDALVAMATDIKGPGK